MTAPTTVAGGGGHGKNILLSVLSNTFAPLAGLATAPILASALGVVGRGEAAGATAPVLLATSVATLGIPPAITYFTARNPLFAATLARRGALMLIVAGIVASAAAVLLAPVLSGGSPPLARLISIASLALVPLLLLALLQGTAAGLHRWKLVAVERLITAVVRLVALSALALTGRLDVQAAVVVLAFSPALAALAYLPIIRRGRMTLPCGAAPTSRAILAYAWRIWIGSISGVLLTRIDQTVMVPLAGAYDLGLYVVAVTIAELPLVINNAVREVTFSSDAAQGSDERLTLASRLSSLVTLGAGVGVGVTAWWWLPLLFGSDFSGAYPVLLILIVAVVLGNPGSVAGVGLSARGMPGRRSLALVLACVVNLALVFLLVPLLGAMGAAVATLAGNVVAGNLNIFFLWRHYGVRPWSFYRLTPTDVKTLVSRVVSILRRG